MTSVLRNHAMNAVVSTFLKAHPAKRRETTELRTMDGKENEPLNRVLLAKLLAGARSLPPRSIFAQPPAGAQRRRTAGVGLSVDVADQWIERRPRAAAPTPRDRSNSAVCAVQ